MIVYVLALVSNKYYVGKTTNLSRRVTDHSTHMGSAWTQKYPPVHVKEVYENCDAFDEDKYTLKMMSEYGITNVRGGSYSQIHLDRNQIEQIERSIRGASDKCFGCGSSDHWVRECPLKQMCTRCGRNSHMIESCYAKTHLNGKSLINDSDNNSDDDTGSDDDVPVGVSSIGRYMVGGMDSNVYVSASCNRCGRGNHNTGSCYERTHLDGRALQARPAQSESECCIL